MTRILNDAELKRLLGTVIPEGDVESVRPNSYVVRLGSEGEFINTGKEFRLGDKRKRGIRVQPGHSVAVTAFEAVDFRRETVRKLFPGKDLHGLISPTTDLSREGIVAPTTQVDAGYFGTLNWTLTNTSSEERRFVFKERIFRLTIFMLEEGEVPEKVYEGDYQSQTGYVRSRRVGAPVGMKETEWEDSQTKGGPEELLEGLIRSGYPWNVLGERLRMIDLQFRQVTNEYAEIAEFLGKVRADITQVRDEQAAVSDTVRRVVRDEAQMMQNRWLLGSGSVLGLVGGLAFTVASNEGLRSVVVEYGVFLGLGVIVASAVSLYLGVVRR